MPQRAEHVHRFSSVTIRFPGWQPSCSTFYARDEDREGQTVQVKPHELRQKTYFELGRFGIRGTINDWLWIGWNDEYGKCHFGREYEQFGSEWLLDSVVGHYL